MQSASNILVLHDLKFNPVHVIHQKENLDALLQERKKPAKIVGFVPTMGALHQGHFSLIEKAQTESDLVVVSIFVNPTQFDQVSDFKNYPQSLDDDLRKLKDRFENLIIFAPNAAALYGENVVSEKFDFGKLTKTMEGRFRSGHFDGVGTVLKKFFTIVKPDKAFFGEKDYQQLLIVKKLVGIMGVPIKIIGCPISRQESGLARSSRNRRLSKAQQREATFLYENLLYAKSKFGIENVKTIRKKVSENFKNHPAFDLEYFEIADAETLEPTNHLENNKNYRAFIVAHLEGVRLIDNMPLN